MMISKCGSKLWKRRILPMTSAVLMGAALAMNPAYGTVASANVSASEIGEIENQYVDEARMEYICALASMSVYDSELNQAIRSELSDMGWNYQQVSMKNSRAETNFFLVTKTESNGAVTTILAIPGTEKTKDVEVDLRMGRVYFGGSTPLGFQEYADKPVKEITEERNTVSENLATVHRGFNDYVQTAFFTPDEEGSLGMDYLMYPLKTPHGKLYITGHSLGGAVGTLLAARLASMGARYEKMEVITFGAPAVGNQTFADYCEGKFRLKRATISKDPIVSALQGIVGTGSVYTQFGEKLNWKRNTTTGRGYHEMAVYLDAAIRNYYDISAGMETANNKPDVKGASRGSVWRNNSENKLYKVYIAPIEMKLHQGIQSDSPYMRAIIHDMLVNQLPGAVGDSGEVKDIQDTCAVAASMGCEYVIFEKITGDLLKNTNETYWIQIEENIYDVTGRMVSSQTTSTQASAITPIETIMYDLARGDEQRKRVLSAKAQIHLGSIFK